MIEKIVLTNFRRFKEKVFDIDKNIIVIHGENAQGKSSFLESLYLISNGYSPWASSNDLINNKQDKQPHLRIEIVKDNKSYIYFKDEHKKIYKIDGKSVRSKTFFQQNSASIFNPEQIELLMISPSKRRSYLDEIISKYNYEYEEILSRFNKVLRQRNAYLKKLAQKFYDNGTIAINDPQLNFWSKEYISSSTEILINRLQLCKDLSIGEYDIKYKTCFDIDKRKIHNKEYITTQIENALEQNKRRDIATGYSNVGPHRDDWDIFKDEDIKRFGSRGEKRLAIGKLIFLVQDIIYTKIGFYPILLLDDIASELDTKNTVNIFNKEYINKQQTFITVIHKDLIPKDILKEAQVIDLNTF